MSQFLRMGEALHPKLVYTLPEQARPALMMYHGIVMPEDSSTHAVCVVHPNGEVRMFPRAQPNDVMAVLAHDYQVIFAELQGISWV